MRTARTIAVLATVALALTALAASPAGGAARRSIAAFARNAGAVNGIKASRSPKPGRLVPLGKNAKLPASVVPTARGAQGLPGPQGQQGWAPEPANQPRPVTEWAKPAAASSASDFEAGIGTMFRPVQVLASAYANAIKAQQQAWAALIGAARSTRESSRF